MNNRRRVGFVCAMTLALSACATGANDSDGPAGSGGSGVAGGPGWPTGGSSGSGAAGAGGSGGVAGGVGGQAGYGGDIGTPVIPEGHPRVYLNAQNRTRLTTALGSGATTAKRFHDMVDQQMAGGDVYGFQAWFAALLYVLTGDKSYGNYAVGEIDAFVASEDALIASGQKPSVSGDSYLDVGPMIGDLALTFDYCYDLLGADQKKRWIDYANQAVWNVWHYDQASWGGNSFPWSGWSVDDPNNNYYFSFLRATMLLGLATLGDNDQAQGEIDRFRNDKIGAELVPAYLADLAGGGSREGTGYGTSMAGLFRLYDIWAQTTGEHIADLTPHARQSIAYMLHEIVPTRDRIAPIGDHARDSTAALFDYHRDYLEVLSALYPNDQTAAVARGFLPTSSVPEMQNGFMFYSDFVWDIAGETTAPPSQLYPVYYAPGTGTIFARSGWTEDATWASFIAGPYTESHAHRDQGSLLVYEREWLAYDANIDSHSGLRSEEEAHNLVRIESDGSTVQMSEGAPPSTLVALHDDANLTYFAADTTSSYAGKAPIDEVFRAVVLLKPKVFVVFDRVKTSTTTAKKVWQLNTPVSPSVGPAGATIQGSKSKLELFVISPSGAAPTSQAWPGLDSDMNGGYRLDLAQDGANTSYFLTVLSLDGAVSSVSASNAAGEQGASLVLADGRTALVRFAESGTGGTLHFESGGQALFDGALPQAVEALPVLKP